MNDLFYQSEKVDELCEKFSKLPMETQKLLFNYAYRSRERHGWFDAINLVSLEEDKLMNILLKTAFEIANFETRCSHYGLEKFDVIVNDEGISCDYALYDQSYYDGDITKANKVLLIDTGLVITVKLLNYGATIDNIISPVMDYSSQDFFDNPYDFILKLMDYADGELGE